MRFLSDICDLGISKEKKAGGLRGVAAPLHQKKKEKTISKFINYYGQKLTCKHKVALTVAVERYLPTTALFNLLTMGVCLECWGGVHVLAVHWRIGIQKDPISTLLFPHWTQGIFKTR